MTDIVQFIQKHGRVPMVERGDKPWMYRGWLGWITQTMHAYNDAGFPDRWGYLHAYKMTGKLPGPIPKVEYGAPSEEAVRNMAECVDIIWRSYAAWSGFSHLCEWLAYGLGVSRTNMPPEPSVLPQKTQEELYRTFSLDLWLRAPHDYLGKFASEGKGRGKNWNPNAFYPTPHNVCECMVQMQMADQIRDGEGDWAFKSVCDPCVGTGRMLMHAGNHSLVLYGADIDGLMVLCSKINGAIFVPWMVCPVGMGGLAQEESLQEQHV